MAKQILLNAYVAVNGVDLSDHANSVQLQDQADQIEISTFSANSYKEYGQGLKDATITVHFFSDFAASSVHSTLQPLYASGGTFSLEIRAVNAAVSSTNPSAKMTAKLYEYTGISGQINQPLEFDGIFRNAGTAGVVWGTA